MNQSDKSRENSNRVLMSLFSNALAVAISFLVGFVLSSLVQDYESIGVLGVTLAFIVVLSIAFMSYYLVYHILGYLPMSRAHLV